MGAHVIVVAAQTWSKFADKIEAIELRARKGTTSFAADETNRPATTREALAKFKPAFRDGGTITAGNAPGINSGGAAVVIGERSWAENRGVATLCIGSGQGIVQAIKTIA